jgi:hypothetical protein
MPYRRVVIYIVAIIASLSVAHAQYREQKTKLERTADHIATSISEMVGWYDVPVGAIYYSKYYHFYGDPEDKPIKVSPLPFENELAGDVGVPGSKSVGSLDPNYLPQLVMLGRAAYALGEDLFTDEGSSVNAYKHAFGLYKTMAYTEVATNITKGLVHKTRPDASDTKSFFSGHTSLTFAMSSFLQREVDDALVSWSALQQSPDLMTAMRIGAFSVLYGWAGYVGYSRMRDNKHYLVDVLLGATIGTLLGNFVYDTWLSEGDSFLRSIGVTTIDGTPCVGVSLKLH